MGQRVHRSSIAQIAGQHNIKAVKASMGLADGEQVEHGLGWVVAGAVAAVEDGHAGGVLRVACCTLTRMPHGDDVGVAVNHLNRVKQGLAFDHGGGADVTQVHHVSAKPLHGRLKGHPCAGAGLEEEVPEDAPRKKRHARLASSSREQALRRVEHFHDVFVGQVCHGDEPGHSTSSEPSVEVHP